MAEFRKINVRRLDEDKIPIKFSLDMLNAFIAYSIKNDKSISRGHLNNLKKLINMVDVDLYKNDQFLKYRLKFLKKTLKLKMDEGIEEAKLLLEGSRCGYDDLDNDIIGDIFSIDLKKKEIKYITKVISNKLSYCFIYKHRDKLLDLFNKMDDVDNNDETTIKDIKKVCTKLLTDVRKSEVDDSEVFSLNPKIFDNIIRQTVTKIQSPGYRLRFGIQGLNDLLSGGVEPGRFYMFLGLPAGGKSGLLLNLAYNIKLFNKNYETRTPGAVPTVLFVTQENNVTETIERLFTLSASAKTKETLRNYSPEEAIKVLQEQGQLVLTQENNIDIVIIYRPGHTIDTGDLYTIIDDLEDEGREVICLIHDYLKRIKSVNYTPELRLELGYVVDEMKNLAIAKNIPVISASQLNREALKTVDFAKESNKSDVGKLLSGSNVGESWNLMENTDWACIIYKERDVSTGQEYMTFRRVKIRFEPTTENNFIAHPYDHENTMRLAMDVGGETLSKTTLGNDFGIASIDKNGRTNAKERQVITFDQPSADLSTGLTSKSLGELLAS